MYSHLRKQKYKIEGKLIYVSHTSLIEYLGQVIHSEKSISDIHPWNIPDVGGILNTIAKGTKAIITTIVIVVIFGLFTYMCCMPLLIKLLSRGRY